MSDGAYESLLAEDVCSCVLIVMCTRTGQRASLTWVERSDRRSADNYGAEILGGIALQLLVKVACEGKYLSPLMSPRFGCDNKGVVHHGNHPWRPLPANQGQEDVLRYYQNLVRCCPAKCKMYHVHGHLDRYLRRDEMSPAEILNCDCDQLAGKALRWAVEHGCYIDRHWGDKVGREYYYVKDIIPPGMFDDVYWDGVEKVLTSCPEMFS
eukprot:scaffold259317_cov96-Cyclotella_meneghiniana.AAC.4